MKNFILTILLGFVGLAAVNAQTIDELKAMKAEKQAAVDALAAEVAALDKQIYEFPGWKVGGVGLAGFNLLANNNWYALGTPNSQNTGLNISLGAYANNDQPKYFWRNLLNANIARSAAFTDRNFDNTKTVALLNGLDLSSLFGYKLSEKLAISAEGKWTSSILEFDPKNDGVLDDEYNLAFNAPGQLTVSAGVTWTPIANLVVLVHPLGYQKNWPGDLISAAGAKIGASYAAEIIPNVSWTSNLSAFVPYGGDATVSHKSLAGDVIGDVAYVAGDLVNWEWLNGFSTSIWKGVGVGFQIGLKQNKQQADGGILRLNNTDPETYPDTDTTENPFQSFYTLGLSYTF